MLSEAQKDSSINYETKEIVNSYCISQNHLNEQIISEEEKKDDNELDSKFNRWEMKSKKILLIKCIN